MYESLEEACKKHADGQDGVIPIAAFGWSTVDFLRRVHRILWKFMDQNDDVLRTFTSDTVVLKTFRDFFQHMDNEYKNVWASSKVSAEATFGRIEFTDCRKSDRSLWSHFVLFPGVQICDWEGSVKGGNIVLEIGEIENITLYLRCETLNLTVFIKKFKAICDLVIQNIENRFDVVAGVEGSQVRENFHYKIDLTETLDCNT